MLVPGLKEFHWEDLVNVHIDLGYCRHRFIQTVNEKIAVQTLGSMQNLERLAKVDDLLKAAGDALEAAKATLFNLCYDREAGE